MPGECAAWNATGEHQMHQDYGQLDTTEGLDSSVDAAAATPSGTSPLRRRGVLGVLAGTGIIAVAVTAALLGTGGGESTDSAAQPAPATSTAPEPDRDGDGTPDRWDGEPDDPTWNAGAPRREPAPEPAYEAGDPADYAVIGERDWALIAKDPDAHLGEKIVLFAEVTQFDSATGNDLFRANAATSQLEYWSLDGTNTIFTGDKQVLGPVVQGDIVKVHATVLGSLSYDTQIGGSTTVPSLAVGIIEVIGHSD